MKHFEKKVFNTSKNKNIIIPSNLFSTSDLNSCKEDLFLSSFIFKKFVSQIMRSGKKFKSEKILKNILIGISLKGYSPYSTLILAVNNVKPVVDTRMVSKKGKKFRVPFLLKNSRQITKAIQTLVRISKNKIYFERFLVEELILSSYMCSRSVKATLRSHKFAFQNRSFSNYRWF